MNEYKKLLLSHGFTEKCQKPDFSSHDNNCFYCERNVKKANDFPLFEYVLLVSHDGKFCEAVYESYVNKKDTYPGKGRDEKKANEPYSKFQKMGKAPVYTTIFRDLKDLEEKIK